MGARQAPRGALWARCPLGPAPAHLQSRDREGALPRHPREGGVLGCEVDA